MDLLKGLNSAQKEAVELASGPLLILAGAGSGKTKTLTHRIANLIYNQSVNPGDILAVTFTNKAAKEMRLRLGSLLGVNGESRDFMPWMGTFHGICVKLLRIDGGAIGLDRNFVIYDEDDRLSLIKQASKKVLANDSSIKPKSISSAVSKAKNQLLNPDDYEATAEYPQQQKIASVYRKYEALKKQASALDFDDLLTEVVRLLKEHPEIRKKWQKKFKHILIDEYQDTNAVQYQLIKMLVNEDKNICVVGDDWQSIYSWRGADFTNILNFERDFKGAKVIKLEQNYRSTGNILDAAGRVIANNTNRTDKNLWTESGEGNPIDIISAYNEIEEANRVAFKISNYVQSGKYQYSDIAVLYRTNAQSYTIERAFLQERIPYQIVGGVRFYDRKEIKDILAYLRLIYQPNDSASFLRIANVPGRGVGAVSQNKIVEYKNQSSIDLISAMKIADQAGIGGKAKGSLIKLGEDLEVLKNLSNEVTPAELIVKIIEKIRYEEYLIADDKLKAEDRQENIGALISDAKNFFDLDSFLAEAALMSSADTGDSSDRVTLMTLHAAKGLEFPVVFIVGLEEGILPHVRVFDGSTDDLEEERRLMYVGMTRARQELSISYANSRMQFGSVSYNPMSRFVAEMGVSGSGQDQFDNNSDYEIVMDEEFIPEIEMLQVGDMVKSAAFGIGEVVDVDGLAVSVKFASGHQKKLNLEYARLEKVTT